MKAKKHGGDKCDFNKPFSGERRGFYVEISQLLNTSELWTIYGPIPISR